MGLCQNTMLLYICHSCPLWTRLARAWQLPDAAAACWWQLHMLSALGIVLQPGGRWNFGSAAQ